MGELDYYRPYEEWWQEKASADEFETIVRHEVGMFEINMTNLKENGLKTRREWMEMFLLWLEYS